MDVFHVTDVLVTWMGVFTLPETMNEWMGCVPRDGGGQIAHECDV